MAAKISYNRENYRKIRAQFEEKPLLARAEAEARRGELWEKVPGVREIDLNLSDTGLKLFAAAEKGKDGLDGRIAALKKENAELRNRRAGLLREAGYPEDYSDVRYECSRCGDTGFDGNEMCQCMKKALALAGYESSGIAGLMREQSFDNFSLGYYDGEDRKNAEFIFCNMKNYAENFLPAKADNVLLMGGTGLGKTHLSTAAAKVIIDHGYDVVYDTAQNIFSDFENERFRRRYDEDEDLTSRYFDCDLLIIDDLGTELTSSFTVSSLYNIINTRENRRKPTMISTNLDRVELRRRYADRITSRIFGEFFTLCFTGRDIRSKKLEE